jgi:RNA ligase
MVTQMREGDSLEILITPSKVRNKMLLKDYVNLEDLGRAVKDDTVSCRPHSRWPLDIYNYTTTAMGKTHDDVTLRRCRGLIVDRETGEIVARPMEAFFNINDTRYPETMLDNLPLNPLKNKIEISEKMDGSMGVIFQYKDNPPEVATRGSFDSEQAKWATAFLQALPCFQMPRHQTLLVEIIMPGNQIVVDYGKRESLVLFAVIYKETGEELTYEEMAFDNGRYFGLERVPLFTKTVAQCAKENDKNREGYVAKFLSHSYVKLYREEPIKIPLRIKIKFENYKLSHRAIFGMTNRDVWETLSQDKTIDVASLTPFTPPAFIEWLTNKITYYTLMFKYIEQESIKLARIAGSRGDWNRKAVAEFFKQQVLTQHPAEGTEMIFLAPVLFSMYDGKDYAKVIWKTLRPARAEFFSQGTYHAEDSNDEA